MEKREKFSSRLGFLLISAGCAIGLGNVWRFPYITGLYGGAAFVLLYLFFLIVLAMPILVMEFSVGRASQKSVSKSFQVLKPDKKGWHYFGYIAMIGNIVLLMFYTNIGGWMIAYFFKTAMGSFDGLSSQGIADSFSQFQQQPIEMFMWMAIAVILAMVVCSLGLESGIEKITKFMMVCLLAVMAALAIRAVTLANSSEGLKFYLVPNFKSFVENGVLEVISAAMGQAFFTLSIGIGSMAIFGSYIDKSYSLTSEAISVASLDTFVAIMAGLIIFPACFAFGVEPGYGPGLVFVTLPNIFNSMPAGRLWGMLFFVFMSFAAMSTIIAVGENIISSFMDLMHWGRKKAVLVTTVLLIVLATPCILGFNKWSDFTILGMGVLDFEDFVVSNNLLPLGSIVYLFFCTRRYGWGWDNFIAEAETGEGLKFPKKLRFYFTWILPIIVLLIFAQGYIDKFL